ncbi:MAG: HEAT repeat domain-containing protein [Thermoguttaceae bacterium]|jgi:HEAT repeat protein|nr:HEAT repeat domain-containing protein [Thermoguttaceae bacterium]
MLRYALVLATVTGLVVPASSGGRAGWAGEPSPVGELLAALEADVDNLADATVREQNRLVWTIERKLEKLHRFGPDAAEAVPLVTALLSEARTQTRALLSEEDEEPLFAQPVSQLDLMCIRTLGAIGPDAAPAVPVLIEILDQAELVRISTNIAIGSATYDAARALTKIGTPAVKSLITALDHQSERIRYHALWPLGDIRPAAEEAIPRLRESLAGDEEYMVRQMAAWTIAKIGSFSDATVAALIAALDDEHHVVRCAAADALGDVHPARAEVVDALLGALDDENIEVRVRAVRALGKQGPASVKAIPVLTKLLDSTEAYYVGHVGVFAFHQDVAESLGAIGPPAKTAVPALLGMARKPPEVKDSLFTVSPHRAKDSATRAIAAIAPEDPDVIAFLADTVRTGSHDLPVVASVWALGRIGPPAASPALPVLRVSMEKQSRRETSEWGFRDPSQAGTPADARLRELAVAVLRLDPNDQAAFDVVADSLTRNAEIRCDIFHGDEGELLLDAIMGAAAWKSPATRRNIVKQIDRYLSPAPKEQTVRFYTPGEKVVKLMVRLDPEGQFAAPMLLARLRRMRPDHFLRDAIVAALSKLPCGDHPILLEMLRSSDPLLRAEAITAMGSSPGMLPEIVAALEDPSARIRLAALRALGQMGARAAPARVDVERLLDDRRLAVRLAAETTLQAMAPSDVEQHQPHDCPRGM